MCRNTVRSVCKHHLCCIFYLECYRVRSSSSCSVVFSFYSLMTVTFLHKRPHDGGDGGGGNAEMRWLAKQSAKNGSNQRRCEPRLLSIMGFFAVATADLVASHGFSATRHVADYATFLVLCSATFIVDLRTISATSQQHRVLPIWKEASECLLGGYISFIRVPRVRSSFGRLCRGLLQESGLFHRSFTFVELGTSSRQSSDDEYCTHFINKLRKPKEPRAAREAK